MNLKALIPGLLVLGSTSAALARPAALTATAQVSWSVSGGAALARDHRDSRGPLAPPRPDFEDATRGRPPFVPVWTTLGTMNRIFDGAMAFAVDPRAARFTALKLQRTAGKSLVQRVQIEFANGRTQTVEVGKYLLASSPSITIDLAGEERAIKQVTVIGRNARGSAYSVLAI